MTAGRPVPDLDRPLSALGWAVSWARREGGDRTAALPLATPFVDVERQAERGHQARPTAAPPLPQEVPDPDGAPRRRRPWHRTRRAS